MVGTDPDLFLVMRLSGSMKLHWPSNCGVTAGVSASASKQSRVPGRGPPGLCLLQKRITHHLAFAGMRSLFGAVRYQLGQWHQVDKSVG